MSKLSEYSKFDHIDSDSDDSKDEIRTTESSTESAKSTLKEGTALPVPVDGGTYDSNIGNQQMTKQGSEIDRYVYEYDGRKVYEWDQNLEEVNIYIEAPPNVRAADFDIQIKPKKLTIGLKGNCNRFIDEATFSKVDTSESSWYLDSGVLNIVLIKAHRGEAWEAALMGRDNDGSGGMVDPMTKEKMKQKLMLERYQEENPGFDFRGATFNGEAPDPRNFMGGIGYR